MLTDTERDELRRLQDKAIRRLERGGYGDSSTIIPGYSSYQNSTRGITLADLKTTLYPEHRDELTRFIES